MRKFIAKNKKARFNYEILDTMIAGICLFGHEVKSIRAGKISLNESFAKIIAGELWLVGAHINQYEQYAAKNYDPTRSRKLLVKRKEIDFLLGKTKEKGLTIIPLAVFLQDNKLVKVELGVGRGKKLHDKRETIKKREQERDIRRKFGKY
ncbi:MAG: SsrA-binding protein SmpB [Patescibacteria group bacterium]